MDIRITFYILKQACTGHIDLQDEERLSDFLNSQLTAGTEGDGEFLRVIDLTITLPDNTKERLSEVAIKKSAIQFIAIQDADLARGLGASTGLKSYPFVEKSPAPVKIQMPECSIMGNIHCRQSQTAYDLLAEPQIFIPLTEAKIFTHDMTSWWKAPFAAINRDQIDMLSN